MSVEEAARRLYERLHGARWLVNVGVGKQNGADCIFLYVKAQPRELQELRSRPWHGFPIEVRKTQPPRLLRAAVDNERG